jgi:hypothetical protein
LVGWPSRISTWRNTSNPSEKVIYLVASHLASPVLDAQVALAFPLLFVALVRNYLNEWSRSRVYIFEYLRDL